MPATPGRFRPSTCQGPTVTPSTGSPSRCSRMTRVSGAPPHVPFHVPRRSGISPTGDASSGGPAHATKNGAIAATPADAPRSLRRPAARTTSRIYSRPKHPDPNCPSTEMTMRPARYIEVAILALALLTFGASREAAAQAAPAGEVVVAWHVTIAPTWFDPSTAPPQV